MQHKEDAETFVKRMVRLQGSETVTVDEIAIDYLKDDNIRISVLATVKK